MDHVSPLLEGGRNVVALAGQQERGVKKKQTLQFSLFPAYDSLPKEMQTFSLYYFYCVFVVLKGCLVVLGKNFEVSLWVFASRAILKRFFPFVMVTALTANPLGVLFPFENLTLNNVFV